jgi:hypothetical protein
MIIAPLLGRIEDRMCAFVCACGGEGISRYRGSEWGGGGGEMKLIAQASSSRPFHRLLDILDTRQFASAITTSLMLWIV